MGAWSFPARQAGSCASASSSRSCAGTAAGPMGLAMSSGVEAEARATGMDDEIAPGAKAVLGFTLKDAAGGTAIVSIAGMKRGTSEWDFSRAPFMRRVRFVHEGPMASSPVSVSV